MTSDGKFKLLIVDDESLVHDSLRLLLPKNWSIHSCLSQVSIPTEGFFHAAFVDMHLDKNLKTPQGPQIIAQIKQTFPLTEIFGMSGDLTMELMEQALASGARRFFAKPLAAPEIKSFFDKIEALWSIREISSGTNPFKWVGTSPEADRIRYEISALRGEKGPILIEGETGTGKEVASHLLGHQEKGKPFVPVNIASIPNNLFESEFFGHVRGAFTGADSLKIGLAEAAHSGDLFLDEIEALDMQHQAKLLRFLESGEIRRVGSKDPIHVSVRIIAASNQSLSEMVKNGSFREDLYFRLSGKKIELPPLRSRKSDIPDLCRHFLSADRLKSPKVMDPKAIQVLQDYNWPGNIRELKRICEQLLLVSPLPIIRPVDVLDVLPKERSKAHLDIQLDQGLPVLVADFEKEILRLALDKCGQDVDQACELIQISRSSFYKKIKEYNLEGES